MCKKFLAWIMTLAMLLSLVPAMGISALASEPTPSVPDKEAKIDTAEYDTLEEAVSAATTGQTVTLLKDVTIASQLEITKAITLDGNGKTITRTPNSGEAGTRSGILVTAGATIQNLTVSGPNTTTNGWDNGEFGIKLFNATGAKLSNITVKNANAGIQVNGSDVTMTDTVDVSGNEFGGIEVCHSGAKLDISGATLKNDGETTACPVLWNDDIKGTITQNSKQKLYLDVADETKDHYYLSGDASVGDVYYYQLADAVDAATTGQTINLMQKVVTLSEKISITDKKLTIDGTYDGNNQTIKGQTDSADVNIELTGNADVTVKNTTFTGFGDTAATVTGAAVLKIADDATAKLTVDTCTFEKFNRAAVDGRSGTLEVKDCTIDCDNGQNDQLTKGIVAYTTATITGCTIKGSNSTYEGWSANGIKTCVGAEVSVKGTTITSTKGGISVARNYGKPGQENNPSVAKVTLEDCSVQGANYAVRVYQGKTGSSALSYTKADVTITGGNYDGDIRVGVGSGVTDDGNNKITIKSGNFSLRPDISYLATNTVVKPNEDPLTKSSYPFVVSTPTGTEVNTVVASDTAKVDSSLTGNEKTAADNAAGVLTAEKNLSINVDEAATKVAQKNTYTATSLMPNGSGQTILATLNQVVSDADMTNTVIVVQSYSDIVIENVKLKDGDAEKIENITYDIQPKIQTVATTRGNEGKIELSGDGQNAIQIGDPENLNVTENTKITIPLPNDFKKDDSDNQYTAEDSLYIKHEKNGKTYIYKGEVTNSNGIYTVTFTNPDGFSSFTVTPTNDAVASVTNPSNAEVFFTNLQDAADYVVNNGTVKLLDNNAGNATISRDVSFTFDANGYGGDIVAGSGYTRTISNTNYYTFAPAYTPNPTPSYSDGSSGGSRGSTSYAITTDKTGIGEVQASKNFAIAGNAVTLTVTPASGWTLDSLTAKDAEGNAVTLTEGTDGTYTFQMPAANVTVSANFVSDAAPAVTPEDTPTPAAASNPFTDVAERDFFYAPVLWAVEMCVTNGVTPTTFCPYDVTTRGQMITFLWRAAGSPESASTENPFTDVNESDYFYPAVLWGYENGYVKGTSETTFGPNDTVTRCQVVTFLARVNGVSDEATGYTHAFTDVPADAYYSNAVAWAAQKGITNGTGENAFSPDNGCTRGEVVTFLHRNATL